MKAYTHIQHYDDSHTTVEHGSRAEALASVKSCLGLIVGQGPPSDLCCLYICNEGSKDWTLVCDARTGFLNPMITREIRAMSDG